MPKKFTYPYPLPAVTVDMAIFTITMTNEFSVLLIRRREDPFQGSLALPGGFVEVGAGYNGQEDQGESVEAAAARELHEETGLRVDRDRVLLEQLYTFGGPGRDPRGRVISVAYFALVGMDVAARVRAGDDAASADWFPLWAPPQDDTAIKRPRGYVRPEQTLADVLGNLYLAFDHTRILTMAVERIRGKIDYDPRIARALLPAQFTLSEFRRVHEIVKGASYDRSNFAKRFQRMVEDRRIVELPKSGRLRSQGRPPKMFKFPETP